MTRSWSKVKVSQAMNSSRRLLDRRSPLVFDVQELGHRPGALHEENRTIPAPADLGLEMIAVPQDSDIDCHLRMEAVVDGVLVTGTLAAQLRGECVRCLAEIVEDATFDLQELFFYPGHEVSDEEPQVMEEAINIEAALRDAVVLELPFAPLCREDCQGLCPDCGVDLNGDPDHDHGPKVDPRWEGLVGMNVEPQD